MDNFRIIYLILRYLEKAMDYDEVDVDRISAGTLKITEQWWLSLMEMIAAEGYVDGVSVKRSADGDVAVTLSSSRITLKGLEYLQENSMMKKAADLAKGIAERIPG